MDLKQARETVAEFVEHYNNVRLHSAIGYVTPKDELEGRAGEICKARDQKLEAAREQRRQKRAARESPNPLAIQGSSPQKEDVRAEDRALPVGNLSAETGSETAGLGGHVRPALPAGPTRMRKIPGGLGDRVPQVAT